jgi:chromosome partitioning protein
MAQTLERLSQRIGFRVAPGFSERVIFRELFLSGLTLLDIKGELVKKLGMVTNISHLAAKQELRDFLRFLKIQEIDDRLEFKRLNKVIDANSSEVA